MLLTYRILQSRQQSGVFRVIIRLKPQVLTQFGKHLALAVTHYNAISSRPGIAAGATINVRDHGGLSRRAIFFKKRALLQWPSSRRMASRSGKPAAKIFSWAAAMS